MIPYGLITKLETLQTLIPIEKAQNKTVSLITGCFDVLHLGHLQLFKFAKENADILIVGLDSDTSIRLSKGPQRPIHNIQMRLETLSHIRSIDYIFAIEYEGCFDTEEMDQIYETLVVNLKPDFLVTNKSADRFWEKKEQRALRHNAQLLFTEPKELTSSTSIITKILEYDA